MNIVKKIAYSNPCYKAGRTITPKGLMLHSVGCPQPSAEVFAVNWNDSAIQVCVHAILQADGTVYQLLPWNRRAWHCGGSGNNTHIGVEMTEPKYIRYTGGSSFTCSNLAASQEHVRGCYNTAVELFADLCAIYKLNPLTDICSHAEGHSMGIASNHGDPEHLWRQLQMPYSMDTFRRDVKKRMNGETISDSISSDSVINAIKKLANIGVMNSPEYWENHYNDIKYLDKLLVNAANGLTWCVEPKTNVKDALNSLVNMGIINSPDYWLNNYSSVKYLDKLIMSLGGCVAYCRTQFIKDIQNEIGVGVDGIAGPVTLSHTPTVSSSKNSRNGVVKYIQKYLRFIGYTEIGQADGVAGQLFDTAIKHYQRDNGCYIDGEVTSGNATWRALLGVK